MIESLVGGLKFGVWGLRFGVWGLGLGFGLPIGVLVRVLVRGVVYPIAIGTVHNYCQCCWYWGLVDALNVTFSELGFPRIAINVYSDFTQGTFAVQHCDVHTDHTSYILVECTFAINSTAPGFVLIQDEHSQYTINTTLQRHEGDVSKGSVNITDLPTGEYRVTVYDEMEDYVNNIFQYSKLLHFDFIANLSTAFIPSQGIDCHS